MQEISLTDTDVDVKGRAFEKFLGAYFRGPAGQYFTPRRIVEFMVELSTVSEKDVILDPACGSGGFLLHAIQTVREKIRRNYAKDQKEASLIEWDFAHKQVFGIEINERIARIAMLNMIIHEDAHGNIECNNALRSHKEFDPRKGIIPGKFTLILTNPPLGKSFKESNEAVLKNFTIAKKSEVISVLFIEMCLRYLDENGLLGIVLDEGILSDPKYQYVRDYIAAKSIIKAVFSLPIVAFKVAGAGAKTSILFLQKKKTEETGDYPVFFAHVEHIGYDAVGRPDVNQLPIALTEWRNFIKDPAAYKPISRIGVWTTQRMFTQLEGRLDAWYYYPPYLTELDFLHTIPCPKKTVEELCEKPKDVFYPGRTRRIFADKEQGLPFLSIRNVKEDGINTEKVSFVSRNTENIEKYEIKKGWILVTRSGTVGVATVVKDSADGYYASEHLLRIIPRRDVDPSYVACMLNSRLCNFQIKRESYGAVIKEISVQSLKKVLVPYPSDVGARNRIMEIRLEARKDRMEKIIEALRLRKEGESVLERSENYMISILSEER